MKRTCRSIALGLVLPALALLLWEIAPRRGWIEAHVLPPASAVARYLQESVRDGSLWNHLGITLARLAQGFLAGAVTATVFGLVAGISRAGFELFDPTIQALRAIPSLAWVPLFLIWLGINELSKVVLIAVGAFFPVYLNLTAGIRDVDRKLIEVGRIHRLSRIGIISRIIFPAAMPAFLTGIRGGLGLAWMFVVAAELIGASEGLGFLLDFGRNTTRPDIILASILLFAVLGKSSDGLLVWLERRLLRWQDTLGSRARE